MCGAGSHTYSCQAAPIQYALQAGLDYVDELEDYIRKSNVVLELVGSYAHKMLTPTGLKSHAPEAAYFFLPDFEVCRSAEISNGRELCASLLSEAKAAVGSPCGL